MFRRASSSCSSLVGEARGTRLDCYADRTADSGKAVDGCVGKKIKPSGNERTVLNVDTFRADGSFTGSSDNTLDVYGYTAGLRTGRCVATGTREFQLTFYGLRWNKEGVVEQFQRVQATMTLSESGAEFTEHSEWEVLDLNWMIVLRGTGDVKGTRLEAPDQD
jgi:hypothetical protein